MSGNDDGRDVQPVSPPREGVPDFAPGEPDDGRPIGVWGSRYTDSLATRKIRQEAAYVTAIFVVTASASLALALDTRLDLFGDADSTVRSLLPFLLAFFGGAFGGTLFAMKWLYHSVARGTWNADRRLWRIFTPLLSAGAAVGIVLLSAGNVIPIFNDRIVRAPAGALGVAIVTGYFSDRAFSALERFAEDRFGGRRSGTRAQNDSSDNN